MKPLEQLKAKLFSLSLSAFGTCSPNRLGLGRWNIQTVNRWHPELRAKLRAINAQTPPKTGQHQRPESKTNQQDTEPSEICKTSIPGSNPGGASKHKSLKHRDLRSECFWSNF